MTADRPADARSPILAKTTPPPARKIAAAVLLAGLALAGVWYGYRQYRFAPLRQLPEADLSSAPPAVRRAIENAVQAVRAAPRSGAAWGALGLYLRAHEFDPQANVCLQQAMQYDPREAVWPYVRGSSLSVRDRPESERCFRIAARLRPKMALPRLRLAELYLEERRLDEAQAEFNVALRLEPENARAMLGEGLVALARGEGESARRWAEDSFSRDPEQRSTVELLIRTAHRLGNRADEARWQEVLDKMPADEVGWDDPFGERVLQMRRDPGGMAALAHDLLARKRLADAVGVLEQLVAMAPETSQWPVLLGQTLIRQGNVRRARQVLDEALHRHPEAADVHFQSGVAYYFEERWNEAAAAFRDALRLKPDFSDAHYNLGHALKQLDDREGALAAFREAIRFRPDFPAAYTNLGELLLASGDREAAREALATAVRLSPHDSQAIKLLKQAHVDGGEQ
jgi:tetratricopeptide (TPR) repeat protein